MGSFFLMAARLLEAVRDGILDLLHGVHSTWHTYGAMRDISQASDIRQPLQQHGLKEKTSVSGVGLHPSLFGFRKYPTGSFRLPDIRLYAIHPARHVDHESFFLTTMLA